MLRLVLALFLVLLPTLVYFGWVHLQRRRALSSGRRPLPWLEAAPQVWLTLGMVTLLAVFLVIWIFLSGVPAGGIYVPARIGQDGQTIPGHFEPRNGQ